MISYLLIIHSLHHGKVWYAIYKSLDLVTLQVAYKMPFNIFRELRCFLDYLLNVVLAETAMASIVDLTEERDWLGFADGDDFNLIGATAGAFCSLRHAVED
uniref:Uncharacterized protein n=1 Tax=Opuntia streptacantha TaxID=393608 RepID=A0A7C9D627_OPUST